VNSFLQFVFLFTIFFVYLVSFPSFSFIVLFMFIFLSHSLSLFSLFSLSYSCIESFLSTFISDFFVSHSSTFILQTVHILSSRRVPCSVSTDTRRFDIDRSSQILSPQTGTLAVPTDCLKFPPNYFSQIHSSQNREFAVQDFFKKFSPSSTDTPWFLRP